MQTLAKLSIRTQEVLYDPEMDGNSYTYGAGTPRAFEGVDKRDTLIVISVLDVCAMLALLGGLAYFRWAAAKEEAKAEAETVTLDDYSLVVCVARQLLRARRPHPRHVLRR